MDQKLGNSILGNPVQAGCLLIASSILLGYEFLTAQHFLKFALFEILVGVIGYVLYNGWEISQPNEWLLIIENGRLVKAGVGLKCFKSFTQTAVRFQNSVNTIYFEADQVTQEKIGLVVKGMAIWGVNRVDDGPFKCYKYMQGQNPDENVKNMCESNVRIQIANSSMEAVIRDRITLRKKIKEELQKQLFGWGVWVETVEITEVKISSNSLFQDLQTKYRNENRLKAEKFRQAASKIISEKRQEAEQAYQFEQQKISTQRKNIDNSEQLKRQTEEQRVAEEKSNIDLREKELRLKLSLYENKNSNEIQELRYGNEQAIRQLQLTTELTIQKKNLEFESHLSAKNLKKYLIDQTENLYSRLQLQSIQVENFVGDQNIQGIPAMGMAFKQLQQIIPQQ